MEFVYLYLTDRIAVASPLGFNFGVLGVYVHIKEKKMRRARLSLMCIDCCAVEWWSPNSMEWALHTCMFNMYEIPVHDLCCIDKCSLPLAPNQSTSKHNLQPFVSVSRITKYSCFLFFNNRSLFAMPLSLFFSSWYSSAQNKKLILESNIHFHH